MSQSDDGGYVHDPTEFDGDGERVDEDDDDQWLHEPADPDAADRTFDWRGWVLVGTIVFAFLVAPGAILLWPPNYNYLVALLILPLVPALLLAVVAVWATTRP